MKIVRTLFGMMVGSFLGALASLIYFLMESFIPQTIKTFVDSSGGWYELAALAVYVFIFFVCITIGALIGAYKAYYWNVLNA